MKFRKAIMSDAETLLRWRNDPETRANSLSTDPIEWEEHLDWLNNSISDQSRHLLIAINKDGKEVGTVRFDLLPEYGRAFEISWTVAPEFRGKGWGKKVVQSALDEPFLIGSQIQARMKRSNIASQKIAEAAGFVKKSENGGIEEWWKDFIENRSNFSQSGVKERT
jgi:RimJ/RimL family protein N-acetyltransferase